MPTSSARAATLVAAILLVAMGAACSRSPSTAQARPAPAPQAAAPARPDQARPDAHPGTAAAHGDANAADASAPAAPGAPAAPAGTPAAPLAAEVATCRGFLDWAERYRAATPAQRAAMEAEGVALAGQRRAALVTLIRNDPRTALELELPLRERAAMPDAIASQLETRFSGSGQLAAVARAPGPRSVDDPDQRSVVPVLLLGGRSFESYTYGRRAGILTKQPVPVHGIAIDQFAAVHEQPVRELEPGEQPAPGAQPWNPDRVCPVSGRSAAGGVVAEVAGKPVYLCCGGHIIALGDQLAASEPSTPQTVARSPYTEGTKTLLYIRARFTDQTDASLPSDATCQATVDTMNAFLNQASYGKMLGFTMTLVPAPVVLAGTAASYGTDDGKVRTDALAAAKAAGYDAASYEFDVVRYNGGPGSFSGQGYVGSRGVWLKTDSAGVASHEFGHNLGLWHANYWVPASESPIGPGSVQEYGNLFDTMGQASAGANHYNAGSKQFLGWLPGTNVHQPTGSGTFRIFAMDYQSLLSSSQKQSLRIVKDATRDYIVELRQRFPGNAWLTNGVTVKWVSPVNANEGDLLIDTTYGSADDRTDSALVIGRTFSDRAAGIHITPIGLGGTTPQSIDVVVNQGAFPGNHAPTVALAGPATAAVSATVSFTATAADADGDALAYAWDFGDRTFGTSNGPGASKAWSAAGQYVVRCTVSDMKGGVGSRSLLVTVGSPSTFAITGHVLAGASGVQGVRVHNGQSGGSYRGTYSDSDGAYILANLAAGAVTVSAADPSYVLTAGFTNPVTVGPAASGKDFSAVRVDEVSIAATDANAAETGGDTGTFRITRTGSTAADLAVAFTTSGSATRTSDYTLAVGGTAVTAGTVTIPAGQAAVDVTLTAVNDGIAEGAETATLALAEDAAYGLISPTRATVTIAGLPGPANDQFANRIALSGASATTTGSNRYATKESGEPAHAGITGGASVWWTWTAPASGTCAIDTAGSAFDTLLGVYTGGAVTGLDEVASNDDAPGLNTSAVSFAATAGTTYQIAVDGYTATTQGAIKLTLALTSSSHLATIVASDATAVEASGDTGTFTVSLASPSSTATTVAYTIGGTASAADYSALSGTVLIPANASSATITVTPVNDGLSEGPETVIATLAAGTGYDVAVPASATITITDTAPPTATIAATTPAASEDGPVAGAFTVTLSAAASSPLSLAYTLGGTASAADYAAPANPLVISAGATTGTITITPIADATAEATETVIATLVAGSGYTVGGAASATVTIADHTPTATASASSSGGGHKCGLGLGVGAALFACAWLSRALLIVRRRWP
jgi:hypothetical protein